MGRISIAAVLGFVAVFAIGLAALVNATSVWAGVSFTLTVGVLFSSVLATILRGWRRGGWLGFALFGWGYFLLGYTSVFGVASDFWLLPDAATEWIFARSNRAPVLPPSFSTAAQGSRPLTPEDSAYYAAARDYNDRFAIAGRIGRWLSVLLFAGVGAFLGILLGQGRRQVDAASTPPYPLNPSPKSLR